MTKKLSIVIEAPTVADKRTGRRPANAFEPGNEIGFKKGTSGNPSGRTKDANRRLISKAVRCQLAMRAPNQISEALRLPKGSSWAQCVGRALLFAAVKGDIPACREIRESTEGTFNKLAFTDENGETLPVPDLTVVFEGTSEGHFMDRDTRSLPPPIDCKAD